MKIGILFDLDGTLLNTLEDLYNATNHILEQFGCPKRTMEEVRRFVGNGARQQMKRSLPGKADDPDFEQVMEAYLAYYNAICAEGSAKPYEGVLDALEEVKKHYPVAVVSNKPHPAVEGLCEKYFPGVYALGVSDDCPRKPAPDMVKKALTALNVDTCVYVGDSEVDVATARNAGVPCLTVLWGFRDRDLLEEVGAKHFCEKAEDIPQFIEEIIQKESLPLGEGGKNL